MRGMRGVGDCTPAERVKEILDKTTCEKWLRVGDHRKVKLFFEERVFSENK